jgi:hypothetical protein
MTVFEQTKKFIALSKSAEILPRVEVSDDRAYLK